MEERKFFKYDKENKSCEFFVNKNKFYMDIDINTNVLVASVIGIIVLTRILIWI